MQTFGLPLMLALSVPIYITNPNLDGADSRTFSLATARNHQRPLLLFAPYGSDPLLREQLDLLRTHDLLDRNVIIVPVPVHGISLSPQNLDGSVFAHMKADETGAVRQRFHIAPAEFTVVLLGKDGGEKLRSKTPVTMDRLNRLIDAMPMRQHEISLQH